MLTLYLTTKRAESCLVCIDCSVQQLDHYRMLDSITYVVCCNFRFTAKECHLLYYKLHGNSTALFTGDFSIINEPYVCRSLQLTRHAITHSTSSARGLNSLFVFSTFFFFNASTLCTFATCKAQSSAWRVSPTFFNSIGRQC